jgi:hypothetical protein
MHSECCLYSDWILLGFRMPSVANKDSFRLQTAIRLRTAFRIPVGFHMISAATGVLREGQGSTSTAVREVARSAPEPLAREGYLDDPDVARWIYDAVTRKTATVSGQG